MNGLEIGRLSEKARQGDIRGLREFIKLAKQEGYASMRGGWLYLDGKYTGIRGWQGLADWVYVGLVHFRKVEVEV